MTLPPDLELRPAGRGDLDGMVALVAACDATYPDWAPAGWEPPPPERERERWHGRIAAGSSWIRVAVEPGGRIVGLVCFSQALAQGDVPEPILGRAHVSAVFTHPDRWREGIAAGLLDAAQEAMRGEGYAEVQLWTPREAPARRFYEATGWTHDGRERWFDDLSLPIVAYVKPL